jgi:chromate reductase, NAD(P)H dehydrogenase (quinone)
MLRVLAVNGSLRDGSHNGALLRAAATLLPFDAALAELGGLSLVPPYDASEDIIAPPPAVSALRAGLASADAVLFSTPEYNSSIPGQLKNALDWASRPFPDNALRGKPVAVVGASTGMFGAVWAQAELRKVLRTIGADVIDRELPVPHAHERFDAAGRLVDRELAAALADVLAALVARARRSDALGELPIAV